MEHTAAATDYAQHVSLERLRGRAHEIHGWKSDLERGLFSFTQELAGLEATRLRLKAALSVLRKPADITAECLTRRAARPGAELVVDVAEEELQKASVLDVVTKFHLLIILKVYFCCCAQTLLRSSDSNPFPEGELSFFTVRKV